MSGSGTLHERTLAVETGSGVMPTTLLVPDGPGPQPCAVLYADNAGLREEVVQLGRELAASAGVAVALPDFYWRSPPGCQPPLAPAERERLRVLRDALGARELAADARALARALEGEPAIAPARLGLVGVCIGGGLAVVAASALAERTAAVWLLDPCEHSDRAGTRVDLSGVEAPVLATLPEAMAAAFRRELAARLAAGGLRAEEHELAGAAHGFCFASWEAPVFDAAARDEAVAGGARFLAEALGP